MRFLQQTKVEHKVQIDQKDRRILSILARNARTPASRIAKEVALSREAVSYRLQQYGKRGLIQGYRSIVDIKKFGYDAYHIFLKLRDPEKEEIVKRFQSYPFMRAIIKFSGKYDYELALIARDIQDFDRILDKILSDSADAVVDYEVMITTSTYIANTFPQKFLKAKREEPQQHKATTTDEKDKEILSLLANDGTLAYQEIARRTHLSADAVTYRIKKMVNGGVILKFVPVINYSALNYNIYAIMLRVTGLTEARHDTLRELLRTDPHLLWAIRCVGSYNVMMYVCVTGVDELHDSLIRLRTHIPEIVDYEILVAYEEYKYTYFPDYVMI